MGAVQEDSRQLEETIGYTELALQTPVTKLDFSVADDPSTVNRDVPSPEQGHLPMFVVLEGTTGFPGYRPLALEDTTYAYNRFLAEVVPNCTLACIRLISAFMFYTSRRSTWKLTASVPQVAALINMSERSAYNAIKEAEDAGFITCIREPQKSTRHTPALPGIWALNLTYDDTEAAQAFYDGDKYRTPLPNEFLLKTVMEESLAVVRYICCVARYTIGFAEPNGRRRLMVEIGSDKMLRDSGIGSKTWLIKARREAQEKNLVQCIQGGAGGRLKYGLVWASEWDGDRSKLCTPADDDPGKNCTPPAPPRQNVYSGLGSKCTPTPENTVPPAEHDPGKKCTTINRVSLKQGSVNRQQETGETDALELLTAIGYDRCSAAAIASSASLETIKGQIEQFEFLKIVKKPAKPLAMLRCAIEQNWGELEGYGQWKADLERTQTEGNERARRKHRNKFCTLWQEYVDCQLREIEASQPRLWDRFLDHEKGLLAARLAGIAGPVAERMEGILTRSFHTDEARRDRAVPFFEGLVMDFWQWDEKLNPSGFGK